MVITDQKVRWRCVRLNSSQKKNDYRHDGKQRVHHEQYVKGKAYIVERFKPASAIGIECIEKINGTSNTKPTL